MSTKIAVVADTHYGIGRPQAKRRCSIGDVLLERAVHRLNMINKPDVVLVLGDVVDDAAAPDAEERLQTMRNILDTLDAPYIAIPGNHDTDVMQFYRVFDRPDDTVDLAGIRFLPFIDKDEPRCWASRSTRDIERIKAARNGYGGMIVSLQHVCLAPPSEEKRPPYNYTNATDVIAAMKEARVTLSISGHHHPGGHDILDEPVTFVTAPGLCESPFPFLEITVDGAAVTTQRHELKMPEELQLVDNHVHTPMAYCSGNMDIEKSISLAHEFGLAGITFTEHSGQLYFDSKAYWQREWLDGGMAAAEAEHDRMEQYLQLKADHEDDFARFSLEIDCDAQGGLLVKPGHRKLFSGQLGSVHAVPGLSRKIPPSQESSDKFLSMIESLCKAGVSVLAHPMRVYHRARWTPPEELFEPIAQLLEQYAVAAELNIHGSNIPPLGFVKECLNHGVRFSFGGDAHNLFQIGDFACHIDLLREAGYDGDLKDVLIEREEL